MSKKKGKLSEADEQLKYEIASELGLTERVEKYG